MDDRSGAADMNNILMMSMAADDGEITASFIRDVTMTS